MPKDREKLAEHLRKELKDFEIVGNYTQSGTEQIEIKSHIGILNADIIKLEQLVNKYLKGLGYSFFKREHDERTVNFKKGTLIKGFVYWTPSPSCIHVRLQMLSS